LLPAHNYSTIVFLKEGLKMNLSRRIAGLCAVLAVAALPGTAFGSDILLVQGHIYTGNPKAPWAQALAITGTRIDAVGTDEEILARRDTKTNVIDLQGRTVIPGISDSHTDLWFGAMALHGFNLSNPQSSITPNNEDVLIEKIKEYAGSHPKDKILFGRADFATQLPGAPTHELLDRAVSDRPVVIHHTSEHAMWVNAKALALAGIGDQPVANPAEGFCASPTML
jgi:predicted amidohydrolase YtcJ